jgi:hypothetical protein
MRVAAARVMLGVLNEHGRASGGRSGGEVFRRVALWKAGDASSALPRKVVILGLAKNLLEVWHG